jgi:ribosomal protein L18
MLKLLTYAAAATAAAVQVIDDAAGRTLVAASTLTADVKSSVEGNGANIVSTREHTAAAAAAPSV